jgi:predicted RNA binding protein YcfA (HicA-like mRNA interferase family)
MSRLPTLKPHQVVRALERAGFEIDHQTGSHVVMPWRNRDLGRGLTLQIIKSAGLTRDEFVELLK